MGVNHKVATLMGPALHNRAISLGKDVKMLVPPNKMVKIFMKFINLGLTKS